MTRSSSGSVTQQAATSQGTATTAVDASGSYAYAGDNRDHHSVRRRAG
ncbi:hypothetical protein ACWCRD_27370 [Streptomyces sp. NPDC002092]